MNHWNRNNRTYVSTQAESHGNAVPRRGRRLLATTVALALTAGAGLGVSIGQAGAGTSDSGPDPLRSYGQQQLTWHACEGEDLAGIADLQCAEVKAPLDYRDPGGASINVAISRLATSVAGKRRGVLLSNPGGPGLPGLSRPGKLRALLADSVRERYDLIGMDPRGVGRSGIAGCKLTPDESLFVHDWLHSYRDATFAHHVATSRSIAETCARNAGDAMRHVTTANTARDMDLIRSVLGAEKISYLGVSYGTYLGAVYTQLFPDRADRIVLDSSVDPTRVWRGMYLLGASAAELAFDRWAGWTAQRDDIYHLGGTPAEVRQTFWDLVHQADREPIDFRDGDRIRSYMLYQSSPAAAAQYVVKLKEAASRPAPAAQPSPEAERVASPPVEDNRNDREDISNSQTMAIVCGEGRDWPRDPEQYRREAVRAGSDFPLAGDRAANVTPCAFWTLPASEPPIEVDNAVGVLLLQNEWDPYTPLASGLGMHRALKGSRLVTVGGGEGHIVYAKDGNACAADAVTVFLTTGALPAADVTCTTAHT